MACIKLQNMIICRTSGFVRLRLADATCVFMEFHDYLGPMFFRDKNFTREIVDWYENENIINAFEWFQKRGNRT